jgi:hypothetical protein
MKLFPVSLFSVVVALCALSGCSTNEAPAEPSTPVPAEAVKVTTTPAPVPDAEDHTGHDHAAGEGDAAPEAPAAPFAGGGSAGADAPLSPTPELDKKIEETEAGKDKKAAAAALAARGTFRMNDDKAGAKVKYRAALDDYRKALALDPENKEAKSSKEMIESIYKSMGRPVPGEEASAK